MEKYLLEPYAFDIVHSKKLDGYISNNYKIEDQSGKKYLLKHYRDPKEYDLIVAENKLMQYLDERMSFTVSKPAFEKQTIVTYEDKSFSRILTYIEGTFLKDIKYTDELLFSFGRSIGEMHTSLKSYRDVQIEAYYHKWNLSNCLMSWGKVVNVENKSKSKLINYYFDQYKYFAESKINDLPKQVIHGDLNDWNVLTDGNQITGVIDFGDMCYAPKINDLAIALAYVMFEKDDPIQVAIELVKGYLSSAFLSMEEIFLLKYLIPARACVSLCSSAEKKVTEENNEYITVSEKPFWDLLEKWITLNPMKLENELLAASGNSPDKIKIDSGAIRKKNLGKSLSLSYAKPIHMSGSAFQYMYDINGNTYLDAYNNIPHVGHCHPKVTEAISMQVRTLNTNTRYIYDSIAEYSEKLLGYFPEKLNKVFFVNSGSAASDLAIRLSQTFTNREHLLVLEHGYHGHTRMGINISAYKFNGKGGKGAADNVTTLPLPKLYQGQYTTGEAYANDAISRITKLIETDHIPGAFIAEPISGCGGQVPLASGYLEKIRPFLQQYGIPLIIDEVQVGFGRLGNFFWGFEMHGVVPDIVVLGKPMANGHPIGAVVTTEEIAEAFNNGMEFFSSFGGNPVSMEAAKAVLETIEEEELQKNAKETGAYFDQISRDFSSRFPQIGDVRNRGLFLGLELVDPATLQPATQYASDIKNAIKENFILTSTDGPFDNVLKLKPPICFAKNNVDHFFNVFEKVLKSVKL